MEKRKVSYEETETETVNKSQKVQPEIPGTSFQVTNLPKNAFLKPIIPRIYHFLLHESPNPIDSNLIPITQSNIIKLNISSIYLNDQSAIPLDAHLCKQREPIFGDIENAKHLNVLFDSSEFATEPTYRTELFKLLNYFVQAKSDGLGHFECMFNVANDSPAAWIQLLEQVMSPMHNPAVDKLHSLILSPYMRGCGDTLECRYTCKCEEKLKQMARLIFATGETNAHAFTSLNKFVIDPILAVSDPCFEKLTFLQFGNTKLYRH